MTDETKDGREETTRLVGIQDLDPLALFGKNDSNLRLVERSYPVQLTYRDGSLAVRGEPATVDEVSAILGALADLVRKGAILEEHDVHNFIGVSDASERSESLQIYERPVLFSFDKRTLRVKTLGQARYVSALQKHDIVFAIGPAGTGKTYLAVAAAVHALKSRQVERILLVRPAVEAGESLGFLPGDMKEKVDPYLRPLYDALNDLLSFEKIRRFLDLGVIEVAPLAYMSRRTRRIALLLAFLLFACLLFPREPSFEVTTLRVGYPAKRDLIAPFQFYLLKDREVLRQEQIQAARRVAPVFSVDETVESRVKTTLDSLRTQVDEPGGVQRAQERLRNLGISREG